MVGASAAGDESGQTPQLTRGTRAGARPALLSQQKPLCSPKCWLVDATWASPSGPLTSRQHRAHCFPARHPLLKFSDAIGS